MTTPLSQDAQLLAMIDERRRDLDRYLAAVRPRNNRLATVGIVCSGAGAAFTAGPAFGGQGFAQSAAEVFSLPQTSIVWQVLCLLAMVVSVVSAVTIAVTNNRQWPTRVTAAETCSTELDGLRTLLAFGQIDVGDAARKYHDYVAKVGFVPGSRP